MSCADGEGLRVVRDEVGVGVEMGGGGRAMPDAYLRLGPAVAGGAEDGAPGSWVAGG